LVYSPSSPGCNITPGSLYNLVASQPGCIQLDLSFDGVTIFLYPNGGSDGAVLSLQQWNEARAIDTFLPPLPSGFNYGVSWPIYVGENTNVANLIVWAVKTPGMVLDPPGTFPAGQGDPILFGSLTVLSDDGGGTSVLETVNLAGDQFVAVVPEPSTAKLTMLGLVVLALAAMVCARGDASFARMSQA
jgi:hypothetical protein